MAFSFTPKTVAEIKTQYATSKDTMLSQVCREIVSSMVDEDGTAIEGTDLLTLDDLEMMMESFQDWQIRQRDRRENPADEKDKTAQVITVDAIARKINAETEQTGIRALRRNGGLIFVQDSAWNPEDDEAGTE